MAGEQVHVEGLSELLTTFRVMPVEVSEEITWELEEAADPVRKQSTQFILSGGGGEPAMRNMSATRVYAMMRVGVSRAEKTVYVVPAWRSTGRVHRPNVYREEQRRMEAALEQEREHVYEKVDNMLDRIGHEHGF